MVSAVALLGTPAGAERQGDQSRWARAAASFTVHLSAHDVPNCDPGAFVQCVCLVVWAAWLILSHSCSVCFPGGEALG